MLSRLPFFLLAALALWLFRGGGTPRERAIYLRLEGPGARQVRSLSASVFAEDERGAYEALYRSDRLYQEAPPVEVILAPRLPEGRFTLALLLKDAAGRELFRERLPLVVTDKDAYLLPVRVPPAPGAAPGP